jgi:hypothetical protein
MIAPPPSIIILSIDSLRYDCVSWARRRPHLDALGIAGPPPTPQLDRLTERAYCFTQAIANAPYTTASHATLLTGRLPPQHGVRAFLEHSVSPGVPTLAEMLGEAGYRTLLMTDGPQILLPPGLGRGFERVEQDPRTALEWWSCNADSPKLLVLHYLDVHLPYGFCKTPVGHDLNRRWLEVNRTLLEPALRAHAPDGEFDYARLKRPIRRLHRSLVEGDRGPKAGLDWYLRGLAWFDRHRLRELVEQLDAVGALDRAIVVVLGDHGEGDDPTTRYHLGHACLMFEDVIRVPLSIRHPDGGGRQIDDQVSLVDVTPTLLDMVGELGRWPGPGHALGGRSLATACQGADLPEQPAYGEYWSRWQPPGSRAMQWALRHRILRTPRYKLSVIGRPLPPLRTLRSLADESFIVRLCEALLGRRPDPDEVQRRVRRIRLGGPFGRWLQYWSISRSAEARQLPQVALYNLSTDPTEQRPRAVNGARPDPPFLADWLRWLDELDASALVGGPLHIPETESQAVHARLQELGYLD